MRKFLTFIDTLGFEPELFWQVPVKSGDEIYDIAWTRKNSPSWSIKLSKDPKWTRLSSTDLEAFFVTNDLDEKSFELQLGASIMTGALFADVFLNGANKLFGPENLERSLEKARRAAMSLYQDQATPPKRKLTIVRSGE